MRNFLLAIAIFCTGALSAQSFVMDLPRVSQEASVSQTVGITDFNVVYHAPSLRERTLMGNLIPYNTEGTIPWRGGADENTVFTTSTPIKIGGNTLAAGDYGLHFWVTESEITAIFSHNSTAWGSFSYNPEEDALRAPITKGEAPYACDRLHYQFESITPTSCNLVMHWGDQYWELPIEVDVQEEVIAGMRQDLQTRPGWLWVGWFESANYCLQNNTNLEEATTWINRSININPNATNLSTHGRILLAQGKSKDEVGATLKTQLESLPVTWKEYSAIANFALNNLEDADLALELASKSADMNANFGNTNIIAGVLEAQGKHDAAIKKQKEALNLSSNAQANNYAYQLLNQGKTEAALDVFKFNAKRFPEDPNVHDSLGEAYHATGDHKSAEASLRKSLSLNPPPNVRANSLRILAEMGVNTAKL